MKIMAIDKNELKRQLIEELNLENLSIDDIQDDTPLFGEEGVGLDSIDALEIIVLFDKYYNVQLSNPEEGKKVFESINTMADYLEKHIK